MTEAQHTCRQPVPAEETLALLDEAFKETIEACPGCLYNCYIMEEGLGVLWPWEVGLKESLISILFTVGEIPTLIQMAKIKANRKTGLDSDNNNEGGGREDFSDSSFGLCE